METEYRDGKHNLNDLDLNDRYVLQGGGSMKRMIKSSQGIFAMAYGRNDAKAKIEALADILLKHIIEYIVYRETRSQTLNHWCNELSGWMHAVNRIKYKNPKSRDYESWLFGTFGTDEDDAYVNLALYKGKNETSTSPYPDFEITDKLCQDYVLVVHKLKDVSIPILISKDTKSTDEWKAILTDVLKM